MKKFLLIGTLLLAVVVALGATGLAYAQTPTPGTISEDSGVRPQGSGPDFGRRGPGGSERGVLNEFLQPALAEAFGLTVDELTALHDEGKTLTDLAIEQDLTLADFEAKLEAAHQQALEQAVGAGALTQEEADAIVAHLAERQADVKTNRHADAEDSPLHTYMQAAVAEAFGLTVEELETLQADGKTLKDLGIEQNLTVAEFQTRLESARQSALTQAVSDGVITQEQADWMQDHPRQGPGGRHGGKAGCEPGGRGFPAAEVTEQP